MNTTQLIDFLKRDKFAKKVFCGVIPIDKLPISKVKRPCSYIINTHESQKPGEHWYALYIPRRGYIEYFDSYGIKPINHQIYSFFHANGSKYIYNKIKLQGVKSTNCGLFSAFFIYFRCRGYSMKQYIKFFASNKLHNDLFIKSLFKKYKIYKKIQNNY